MEPYAEPMAGERTGVTTAVLVARWGPIVARGLRPAGGYQVIVFGNGFVFDSTRWRDGEWLPWSRVYTNDYLRLARHLDIRLEFDGPVAQSAERPAFNREVAGSTPAWSTTNAPDVAETVQAPRRRRGDGGSTPPAGASRWDWMPALVVAALVASYVAMLLIWLAGYIPER